jgi:hypothetical protein
MILFFLSIKNVHIFYTRTILTPNLAKLTYLCQCNVYLVKVIHTIVAMRLYSLITYLLVAHSIHMGFV